MLASALALVLPALACDDGVLGTLHGPDVPTPEVAVTIGGATTARGEDVAGALATFRSPFTVEDWYRVLARPEDQEKWHPAEIGTARVERLDPTHIFQQVDISALWGAVRVRRQIVVETDWRSRIGRLESCWFADDPDTWRAEVAPWATDAPFQRLALGMWSVDPLPDGGTRVAYQFWAENGLVPAKLQSWAMSRTLPTLMHAFQDRVGELARAAGAVVGADAGAPRE